MDTRTADGRNANLLAYFRLHNKVRQLRKESRALHINCRKNVARAKELRERAALVLGECREVAQGLVLRNPSFIG